MLCNFFVRWLSKQRGMGRWNHPRRNRRLDVVHQSESLEVRLVLDGEPPILTETSFGPQPGTHTIYEDRTGDGLTPDDQPVLFGIPVVKVHFVDGEVQSRVTRIMANGGSTDPTFRRIQYKDENFNGKYDFDNSVFPPYSEPIVFEESIFDADEFLFVADRFEANGQQWMQTSTQYDNDDNQTQSWIREFTVQGLAYEDLNANGQRDNGEPGFGANIFIDFNNDGLLNEPIIRSPLNDDIVSSVGIQPDGVIDVTLQGSGPLGFGFHPIQGFEDQEFITITEGLGLYSSPGPNDGNVVENVVFGVFRNGRVQGNVFDDLDFDGQFHPARGDQLSEGVKIWLEQDGKLSSQITDSDGFFSFFVGPGPYRVFQDLSGVGVSQTLPAAATGYTGTITQSNEGVHYFFGRAVGKDILLSAATRMDGKGVDFSYDAGGDPGKFEVALFRSANTTWDANDVQLGSLVMVSPGSGIVSGTGRFQFPNDYVHDPDRPNLIVVVDPRGRITEVSESNNERLVERIIDISPYQVVGEVVYNAQLDQFESESAVQVGFKPTDGEAFVPLVSGNVAYNEKQIKLSGELNSSYGAMPVSLFVGSWSINVQSAATSNFLAATSLYKLVGVDFEFEGIELVNPDGGSALDSYLNVQGELTAPEALGGFQVKLSDPNFIHLGPQAHGISASIPLGGGELAITHVLTLEAEDAAITYLTATDQNPEGAFRLQGKFTVKNETLEDEDDNAPSLDISGTNYVEFGATGVYFVGAFGLKNWSLSPRFLTVKSGTLFLDTVNDEWKIDGELLFKRLTDKTLILGAGMLQGDFNYFQVGLDELDFPTPMAGVFLQKVVLSADNISALDKEAMEISATIGLTEGPKITIPDMPLIGVESQQVHAATLSITGMGSREHLGGSVEFVYLSEKLLKLTGAFDWNWQKNEAKLSGGVNVFNGSLVGSAQVTVNQRGVIGSGQITGTLKLPDVGPYKFEPIANAVVRAYFQYSDNGFSGDDYAAFSTDVDLPILGKKTVAVRVTTDGGLEFFLGMVSLENLEGQQGTLSFGAEKSNFGLEDASPDTFAVPTGVQQLLLSATWENESENVELEIVRPDGSILHESDLDGSTAALIPQMTSSTSRAIALLNPTAGDWLIRVVGTDDLGATQFAALREGVDPTVELLSAQVSAEEVVIEYTANDPDSEATVTLFYDTDGEGFNGTALAENLPVTGDTATQTWNLSQAFSGTYHLYAMISDGHGGFHFHYLDSPITVDADAPISSVMVLPATKLTPTFAVSWSGQDDLNGSGIASYDLFVSDNNGDYELWLDDTTETTANFTGEVGHTYRFYSVATDGAGRVEESPTQSDATTSVILLSSMIDATAKARTRRGQTRASVTLTFDTAVTLAGGAIDVRDRNASTVSVAPRVTQRKGKTQIKFKATGLGPMTLTVDGAKIKNSANLMADPDGDGILGGLKIIQLG